MRGSETELTKNTADASIRRDSTGNQLAPIYNREFGGFRVLLAKNLLKTGMAVMAGMLSPQRPVMRTGAWSIASRRFMRCCNRLEDSVPGRLLPRVLAFGALLALGARAVVPAEGATWYVDKDAAGVNNGTSWANAWTSFSSVVWGANGVKGGDTLYISGGSSGKTYTETLTIGASGTSSSRIYIKPGADTGHNGAVIWDFDSRGDSGSGNAILLNSRSYITIDGEANGANGIVIKNLRNVLSRSSGVAILGDSSTGVVIKNLDVLNVNIGIRLANSSSFEIYNNRVQARGDSTINVASSSGTLDSNRIHHNSIEILVNTAVPPGGSGAYLGPDGIQCHGNVSIFNNRFKVSWTTVYTSTQHPDCIQVTGDNVKIYNNEFVNIGDSGIDRGLWADQTPNNIWIYNNVFRIVDSVDSYPEFIRLYAGSGGGNLTSLNNLKILNNLFIDNVHNYYPIRLNKFYNTGATGSGNEIKNNIFYNMGTATYPVIFVEEAAGVEIEFDRNVYYNSGAAPHINYRGTDYSMSAWKSAYEPGARTGAPEFVSYAPRSANNDLRLKSSDTVARDAGLSFSSAFDMDKDGVLRPQGVAWDIGPYEYSGGSGADLPPIVSAGSDLTLYLPTNSATLRGSATDPEGKPLNLGWSLVSGPGPVSFSSPNSAISGFSCGTVAGTYVVRLTASDGVNSASAEARISVNPPVIAVLEAEAGIITAPFVAANGAITQSVNTSLEAGGRAVFNFNVPARGNYIIDAMLSAPGDAANSLFVNVDGDPTDPYMVWDISPITSGFENRSVAWRGNGTFDANEFNPKVFTLSAGQHSIVIIGREAGVAVDRLAVRSAGPSPNPPRNFRVVN